MSKEYVLIHKNEPPSPQSRMDRIEQLSRIFAAVALPLILGYFGWQAQQKMASGAADDDYVKLAVSILSDKTIPSTGPNDFEPRKGLRVWAVQVMNSRYKETLPPQVRAALGSGSVTIPTEKIQALDPGKTGWCYFGRWSNVPKGWHELYFNLDQNREAEPSGTASPREPVDLRNAPEHDATSIGVLQPTTTIKYEDVKRAVNGEIWARVTVLKQAV